MDNANPQRAFTGTAWGALTNEVLSAVYNDGTPDQVLTLSGTPTESANVIGLWLLTLTNGEMNHDEIAIKLTADEIDDQFLLISTKLYTNLLAIKTKTNGMNFTGTDIKSTLDGEKVAVSSMNANSINAAAIAAAAVTKIQAGLAVPGDAMDLITDALDAAAVKADAVTKIQAGLATGANITSVLAAIANNLTAISGNLTAIGGNLTAIQINTAVLVIIDTVVDAIKLKTDKLPTNPAATGDKMDLVNNAVDADVWADSATTELIDAIIARVGAIKLIDNAFVIILDEDVNILQTPRINYVRGDTHPYVISVVDNDGTPVNLTGCKIYFTVKEEYSDLDSAAILQKTSADVAEIEITDFAGGIFEIKFLADDTEDEETGSFNDYKYDIQIKDSSNLIWTRTRGVFRLYGDVTKKDD